MSVQLDGVERSLTLGEFEDLVRSGVIGPHTPVRSEAVSGGAWVEAGTLPTFHDLARSPAARFLQAWENPRIPWMTALICGVCLRVWLWTAGTPVEEPIFERFTRWVPGVVEQGEAWRLWSYALLHSGAAHIANNVLMLAWTGLALETILGGPAVLALFVVSAVGGGAFSGWLDPEVRSVGASAADFGFLGATALIGARYREVLPVRARGRFGVFLFVMTIWVLVNGLFSERVDNAAHLGGLLAGTLFTILLVPVADAAGARRNLVVSAAGVGGAVLLSAGAAAAGPHLVPYEPLEVDAIHLVRPGWWEPGWATNRDGGWVSPTGAGAVAARTFRDPEPTDLDRAEADLVESFRTVWPDLVSTSAPTTVDGVAARRVALTAPGGAATALVVVRGRYVHTVVIEAPPTRFGAAFEAAVTTSVRLTDPDALKEAVDRGDTPRGRVARAEVLADLGRLEEALTLLSTDDLPTGLARLRLLADARDPRLADTITAVLTRHPDERRAWVGAADAWGRAGDTTRQAEVVAGARARWPGDAALEKALGAP